jgi:hypothetical protein
MSEPEQKWGFSPQRGGSRRSDGLWFEATLSYTREVHKPGMPDWVWLVHWSSPALSPVWIDPEKRGLKTPAEVEEYIDAKWPLSSLPSVAS